MPLSVGIVGLPNVGKSTFFNAITNARAEAQNYPFCTIAPNTGIVMVPDSRLSVLTRLSQSEKTIPAAITFVDIAGLVKGAAQGEGLGNQFLAHIREVSVIAQVVRCFEDPDIVHVGGRVDPLEDIAVINAELALADLEQSEKMLAHAARQAKRQGETEAAVRLGLLEKANTALAAGKPVRSLELDAGERAQIKNMGFLTEKKILYIANVGETQISHPEGSPQVAAVRQYAQTQGDAFASICAKAEEEISRLAPGDREEFLKALGIAESGLEVVAKKCFTLLGLQTFLTTGPKETRAWTIQQGDTAPQAAGVIHSDFERGFIRANIVSYDDLVRLGGVKEAREKGLLRQEGREYVMREGDVVEFLFNV